MTGGDSSLHSMPYTFSLSLSSSVTTGSAVTSCHLSPSFDRNKGLSVFVLSPPVTYGNSYSPNLASITFSNLESRCFSSEVKGVAISTVVDFASRAWATAPPACSLASTFNWLLELSSFFMVAAVCETAAKCKSYSQSCSQVAANQ